MQSYGGRDQAMGFYYTKLLDAGAVDEEFVLYGFMYLNQQEPVFFITGQEQKAFEYLLECEQKGIYCTPVLQKNYWAKVAGGERQKLKRKFQFDIIRKLETMYGSIFFEAVAKLHEGSSDDAALAVLLEWKKQLDGSYDENLLHLYEATVSMTVQMKLLTVHTGEKLIEWVHEMERQLRMDKLQQEGDSHIYAGLAYLDADGKTIRYLQFGKHYTAWQKRQQLMLEGRIVSPVFQKQMFFTAVDFHIIQQKKQEFEACMRNKMQENYFEYLKRLYALPAVVHSKTYRQLAELVQNNCNENEKTAFRLFGAQRRML